MKRIIGIISILFSLLFLVSCNINHKAQSGVEIIKDYTTDSNVDELVVKNIKLCTNNNTYGPKLILKSGNTKSVKITMQESMEKEIDVNYSFSKLTISGSVFSAYDTDIEMVIEISGYVFEDITLTNAVRCEAESGVFTNDKLDIELSGASQIKSMELNNKKIEANLSGASILVLDKVRTNDLELELSGASIFKSTNIKADYLDSNLSGASKLIFEGEIKDVDAYLSGASVISGYDLVLDTLDAGLSGASGIEVTVNKQIKGSASGASIVNYKGSATSTMSTSGGSIVSHVN